MPRPVARLILFAALFALLQTAASCAAQLDNADSSAAMPLAATQARRVALLTDLADGSDVRGSLKLLLGDELTIIAAAAAGGDIAGAAPDSPLALPADLTGLVVIFDEPQKGAKMADAIRAVAERGLTVVIDTAAFAAINNIESPLIDSENLSIVHASDVTSGLDKGAALAFNGQGKLRALPQKVSDMDGVTVLATAGKEKLPALIEQKSGRGRMIVTDLRTPAEPYIWDSGSFYKYLFVTSAVGNRVRFGKLLPMKPTYEQLVRQMKELAREHDSITIADEGKSSDDRDIYSLAFGNPQATGLLILGCVHGNEWENGPALVVFMQHLAEKYSRLGLDPDSFYLKAVPIVCPWGYDNISRLNVNGVNLNRNGDTGWQEYRAADTNKDGSYGPGDADWKGSAPFSEAESRIVMNIIKQKNYIAVLDLHSNPSGSRYNKLMAARSRISGAKEAVEEFSRLYNSRIESRYILRQQHEKKPATLTNEMILGPQNTPTLNASSILTSGRHSILVEMPGGVSTKNPHATAYATLMCNDLVSELCLAFISSYSDLKPPSATEAQ